MCVLRFVELFVFLLLTTYADCNQGVCSFLYNNSNWDNHTSRNDTYLNVTVQPPGSVTGVITIHYSILTKPYNDDGELGLSDVLRFVNQPEPLNTSKTNSTDRRNDLNSLMMTIIEKGISNEFNQPLIMVVDQNSTRVEIEGRLYKAESGNRNLYFTSATDRLIQLSLIHI